MSRLSGTVNPYEELYASAKEFLSAPGGPSHIEAHRDLFKSRAMADVSNVFSGSNPLALAHERARSKDHFRGLKFTYLEQEAKKSFLFSITGDSPERVEQGENEMLQSENVRKKAKLKAVKDEIEGMRAETVALSAENAKSHATLAEQTAEITKLQREIRDMELELARIKAQHPPEDRMTVDEAEAKLDAQVEEIERLTSALSETAVQSDELRTVIAERARRVLVLAREREVAETKAGVVRRARAEGGTGTQVHDLCTWYEAALNTYRRLLGIRSARALSPSELVLEYDVARGTAALTLHISRGVLFDARLDVRPDSGSVDIREAINTAIERNDAPGLIADVLVRLRTLS